MAGINITGIELRFSYKTFLLLDISFKATLNLIFVRCLKKKRGSGDGVLTTELIHIL
jgi:hypothetical protein